MEVKSTLIIESSILSVSTTLKFKVNRIDIEYICQLSRRLCMLGMKLIEYERLESTSEKRVI